MSKILDAVSNAINTTTKPATPAKKATAKKQDAVPVGVLPEELELAIKADLKAHKALDKAEGAEFASFKALVLKCNDLGVFEDTKLLKLVQVRIALTFKSDSITAIRNTMLNNVVKVAYGGTVGRKSDGTQKTVSGKGWKAVLEVLTKATSIRTLRPLIAAARPEPFKAKPKTEQEIAEAAKKARVAEERKAREDAAKKTKTITPGQVDQAVLELLSDYVTTLSPGSDAELLDLTDKLTKCINRRLEQKQNAA